MPLHSHAEKSECFVGLLMRATLLVLVSRLQMFGRGPIRLSIAICKFPRPRVEFVI